MATKPITCPTSIPEGFVFYKGNLVIDDGLLNSPPVIMTMKDIFSEVSNFSKLRVTLKAGKCFLLSQTDVADEYGYVSFIAAKATFGTSVVESKKYLTWEYEGVSYNMGELMVLSGKKISTTSSIPEGWFLSKPGVYYQNGGILFCNPHSDIDIKLEILVAN